MIFLWCFCVMHLRPVMQLRTPVLQTLIEMSSQNLVRILNHSKITLFVLESFQLASFLNEIKKIAIFYHHYKFYGQTRKVLVRQKPCVATKLHQHISRQFKLNISQQKYKTFTNSTSGADISVTNHAFCHFS